MHHFHNHILETICDFGVASQNDAFLLASYGRTSGICHLYSGRGSISHSALYKKRKFHQSYSVLSLLSAYVPDLCGYMWVLLCLYVHVSSNKKKIILMQTHIHIIYAYTQTHTYIHMNIWIKASKTRESLTSWKIPQGFRSIGQSRDTSQDGMTSPPD